MPDIGGGAEKAIYFSKHIHLRRHHGRFKAPHGVPTGVSPRSRVRSSISELMRRPALPLRASPRDVTTADDAGEPSADGPACRRSQEGQVSALAADFGSARRPEDTEEV